MAGMNDHKSDIQRMREEYARRDALGNSDERYSRANPVQQWILADRQKAVIDLLGKHSLTELSDIKVLELGCGTGGVLEEFRGFGARETNLFGVDLLFDRLLDAQEKLPGCPLVGANGQNLPFDSDSFDLVLQFTAFSSILEQSIKEEMAKEILRVVRPGGGILWYDFIWNPTNRQTRGINLTGIKKLFPGLPIFSTRITLPPPLTRRLLPNHQPVAERLTQFRFLNSHLLAWIGKLG